MITPFVSKNYKIKGEPVHIIEGLEKSGVKIDIKKQKYQCEKKWCKTVKILVSKNSVKKFLM